MKARRPVLVTGAYGLIGHAVVAELQRLGLPHVATDRLATPPADAAFTATPLTIEGVAPLAEFIREHDIGAIVHTAAISGPMLARDDPHRIFAVNVGGTLDLLEAARRAGVARLVHLSSASVYGAVAGAVVAEDAPLRATSAYGCSKVAAEAIARAYCEGGPLEVVILRPSWVYGPRRRTECIIRSMLTDALAERPTHLPYGRGIPRQFVYVEDVARAVIAALEASDVAGRAFNISDGARETMDAVARIVTAVVPSARVTVAPGPPPDDEEVGLLDTGAAAALLGWRPSVDLAGGVAAYAAALSGAPAPPPFVS